MNHSSKVQGLVPRPALKIYTLAKTHRQSPSGEPMVSKLRAKQECEKQRLNYQEPFASDCQHQMSDTDIKRIIVNQGDMGRTQRIGGGKERMKYDREKDLVNWCLHALKDKTRYPVFPAKPQLRSQRSISAKNGTEKACGEDIKEEADEVKPTKFSNNEQALKQAIRIPGQNERKTAVEQISDDTGSFSEIKRNFRLKESNKKSLKELSLSTRRTIGVYGEGWQDRRLDRARELKAKRLERVGKVAERQHHDMKTLEEKQVLEDHVRDEITTSCTISFPDPVHVNSGTACNSKVSRLRERDCKFHSLGGIKIHTEQTESHLKDCGSRNEIASYTALGEPKSVRNKVNKETSYENFKNNLVHLHPYRLGKFKINNCKRECWITQALGHETLPDNLLDFIPRPKSAPSIPSKCRKFVLVRTNELSDDHRNLPEPATPLEETLLLKRFPKCRFRSRSRQSSALYRPCSVAKIQTVVVNNK